MNDSGRYFWFVSDAAIMYGMYSSMLCPVSCSAAAAQAVASYSHELSPKHFDLTYRSIEPYAGDDIVWSRT